MLAIIIIAGALSLRRLVSPAESISLEKVRTACLQEYNAFINIKNNETEKENDSSKIYKISLTLELFKVEGVIIPVTPVYDTKEGAEWVRFYLFKSGDLKKPIASGVRYLGPMSSGEWRVVFESPLLKSQYDSGVDLFIDSNVVEKKRAPKRTPISRELNVEEHMCPLYSSRNSTTYKAIDIKIIGTINKLYN